MKKQFITGFLTGAITFGTMGALAAGLVANPNPFAVQLNGNNVSIEGYNIEGSTYFKLRDIADTVGGFTVDFQNNTIQLAKNGYVYNNQPSLPSSGELQLNLSNIKTSEGFSVYTDTANNQYLKLTDINSIVSKTGPSVFDMWIVGFNSEKTNWRIEYINVMNDYLWNNDLVYAMDGGPIYTQDGVYYILESDYRNKVTPNLGLIDGKPNPNFKITK